MKIENNDYIYVDTNCMIETKYLLLKGNNDQGGGLLHYFYGYWWLG